MKHIYLLIFIVITHSISSQNFTDTKGQLQISNSGTAIYKLAIATPPSIKNVMPQIFLSYSSGIRGGIAGQGWGISSISSISRIATRRDIDGFTDGVDFDNNDKLALDGQRLLIKTGNYWEPGSTYQTEFKSSTKIELKTENSNLYFVVTAQDGSRSWYGSRGNGNLQNAISVNSWYIVRYEDVYGNSISYSYSTALYNGISQLYIYSISFSGNSSAGIDERNVITFVYRDAKRIEKDFIKGSPVYASKILDRIDVTENNALYRRYQLTHTTDVALDYERLTKIEELNSSGEHSNPVNFSYNVTPVSTTRTEKQYTNTLNFDNTQLSGDFDGDGRLDFTTSSELFTNLFIGSTGNAPFTLPFTGDSRKTLTATTLTNGKLNQFQSIINTEETLTSTKFRVYNFMQNLISESYNKEFALPNKGVATGTCGTGPYLKDSNEYLEGDFNGDGISEILIISTKDETRRKRWQDQRQIRCEIAAETDAGYQYNLIDLNPSSDTTLGSKGFIELLNPSILDGQPTISSPNYADYVKKPYKRYVADFNSDGKSDILIVNHDKTYKIVSFKQLTVSPWVELELIGSGTLDKYSSTKQLVLGDFNGDNKTDILLPDTEGGSNQIRWHIYYSNPNPAGGEYFVKESLDIVEYWPDTGNTYTTQTHFSSYYAIDVNGDGKSDLIRVRRKYYKPAWTINDHNTEWQVTAYTNNIGKASGSVFNLSYDSGIFNSDSPDIPIPIIANYKYKGANTELVFVRGKNKVIEYYQFNKNVLIDNQLSSISEANGNITQIIDYQPMRASNDLLGSPFNDFYSSGNNVLYPNIEIIRNPESYLVSKLTVVINGVSKYQSFRYRSFISNFDVGSLGFLKTTRSNWFLSESDTKIWTTEVNDINLRGANTTTWSNTSGSTVFETVPTNLLSSKVNVYSNYTDPVTKVYNVLLDSQTITDVLTGIKSVSSFTYDGDVSSAASFGLQTQNIIKKYSGTVLHGTSIVTTLYENNPSGTGALYYIGRPIKVTTNTQTYAPDTRTSEKTYTYTGFNLTKIEKKGHNTDTLVEEITYDSVGNILSKSVSAPSSVPALPTRTNEDQYDSTKRFVIKKINTLGNATSFDYNNFGLVTKSTDYLGVVSDFTYDNWGKILTATISNKSANPLITNTVYNRLGNGGYTITESKNDGSTIINQFDVLSRPVIKTSKGFSTNTWVSRQNVYDGLGRLTRVSDPYQTAPNKWTWYEYDYLNRTVKIVFPTDKIQTIDYNGLITTTNDDGRVSTSTIDALDNKVQSTDQGGTINFTYYGTGQLKEADYQGNKVTVSIDGWGNKIQTNDPNAGTYSYTYDAFSQIKTETTPNGTTSYTYDNSGNLLEKTIIGTKTNSKTTYSYNSSTNMLTGSSFLDQLNSTTISNSYQYDSFNRLFKSTETTPYATFIKEINYDALGRIEKETSTAVAGGKTSTTAVRNTYVNGFPWQLIDDATQQVLWQTNTLNERGEILTASLANGITINNTYDQYGYPSQFKYEKTGSVPVDILTYNSVFEPKRGNLTNRSNISLNWNENLTYDSLDRLISYKNAQGQTETQDYDNRGKITQNSVGTYNYNNSKIYQNNSITLTPAALTYYLNRALTVPNTAKNTTSTMLNGPGGPGGPGAPPASTIGLEITYNTFKSPVTIRERGGDEYYIDYIDFIYNDGNDRSTMFYGGLNEDKLLRRYRKHYSSDGRMEIKEDRLTGTTEFITFIGGDGYSAPLLAKSDGSNPSEYLYLHRDFQGSILTITNSLGNILEKRLFDAWGSILKVENGSGASLNGLTILDRGYTGHEHIQNMGLINMNGRLYDPKLHRFLQPDNLVTHIDNTQSYNRYGYVLNNPFKYTDPSGEEPITFGVAVIVGAAIAIATYTFNALLTDVPFNLGGLAKATFVGAATAAVTFGVGSAASSMFTSPALGFWSGATQGAIIGVFSGAAGTVAYSMFNGNTVTLKSVLGGMAAGGLTGGILGGIQSGIKAEKAGLDFWSGAGEYTASIPLPADPVSTGRQYLNTADVREDYNTNIATKDGITLEQVENKINTTVYMANRNTLPRGYTMDASGRVFGPRGEVGGYTYSYSEGNIIFSRSSQIAISPATKGYELALRNMIFKHEFMHAWHWSSGFKGYHTYTERATSSFSLSYVKTYGIGWEEAYRGNVLPFPEEYSWKNFDKIIPTWLK